MTQSARLAPIAITSGEPAGIGPELMAKFFAASTNNNHLPFIYIGSHQQITDLVGAGKTITVAKPEDVRQALPGALPVLDIPLVAEVIPGQPDARNAASVLAAIDLGAEPR